MINDYTKRRIKEAVGSLLLGVLEKYDRHHPSYVLGDQDTMAKAGRLNPFHQAILTPGMLRLSRFERSFSTTLGSMFEVAAELIGQQHYADSIRAHDIDGYIGNAARAGIDAIIDAIRRENFEQSYHHYVETIVSSFHADNIRQSVKVDLYLRDHENNEIFFEMKGPKPNLDQCVSVTRKFLEIHALRKSGPPRVRTYFGMSYNPYGARQLYGWSVAKNYLDMDAQVLIGSEFWDLLGGPGTYEEVLSIFGEVGTEYRDALLKVLQ